MLVSVLKANERAGAVFSNAALVNTDLSSISQDLWSTVPFTPTHRRMLARGSIADLMLRHSFVTGATLMFRRQFVPLVVPFPTEHSLHIHDRWIALLIAAVAELVAIDSELILYRQHADQQIGVVTVPDTFQTAVRKRFSQDRDVLIRDLRAQEAIQDRLRLHPTFAVNQDFKEALQARIDNLKVRTSLPNTPIQRLAPIARELMAGRYSRCSNGIWSALKDLVMSVDPVSAERTDRTNAHLPTK
jgi:hypothetical protein